MGQSGEEELTNEERVWLEAHPNIKDKIRKLDILILLVQYGYAGEEMQHSFEKWSRVQ